MNKIIFVVIFLILFTGTAHAHKPIESDGTNENYQNALKIPDHKISWVIYENLESNDAKFYEFDAKKDDSFYASIVIPKLEQLENYKPSLALIGEGIPTNDLPDIEATLPAGGITIYNYDGEIPSKEFYEPFGQATYWERQEINIEIPETGSYYLVVYDTQRLDGKYSLAVGKIEDFSFIDFFTVLPKAWFDTKIFFEDYFSITIVFAALLIPSIILLQRKKMKKKAL